MSGSRPTVSVIVPAFDEAENVGPLLAAIRRTFDAHAIDGEVVLVDDGSTDRTYEAACDAALDLALRARVLAHPRNRGKTEAIVTAAAVASGRYLVLLDADLQYAPDAIPRFLHALASGADMVTARKVGPYPKRIASRIYNWLSRVAFGVPVRDCNSMKAMRREVLDVLPARHDWHRFLVPLAVARGHSVRELDVTLHPRRAGRSKYAGAGRLVTATRDLLAVWCHLHAPGNARSAAAFPAVHPVAGDRREPRAGSRAPLVSAA